jgi:hypothetical protein
MRSIPGQYGSRGATHSRRYTLVDHSSAFDVGWEYRAERLAALDNISSPTMLPAFGNLDWTLGTILPKKLLGS